MYRMPCLVMAHYHTPVGCVNHWPASLRLFATAIPATLPPFPSMPSGAMSDTLETLDPEQLAAVTATEGFVRVVAGAGSGKTRALARRFAWLVNDLGILPGNILCVTFTNKSAAEMRERIHRLVGDADTGYVNTFHGFCVGVLREDSRAIQYPKSFVVLDNADIDDILKEIYAERGLTLRDRTFAQARDRFEIRKCLEEPSYAGDVVAMSLESLKAKYDAATTLDDILFYGYLHKAKKVFGLDYNDLILFTLLAFERDEGVRRKWQERLEYVMVDEFQDIDALQYRLLRVLVAHHRNLFVVGDPDQTIYTWRGADVRFLIHFEREFPGARTVMMNRNYRSTPEILAAANSLIRKNRNRIPKDLVAQRPGGAPVVCHLAPSPAKEAKWIADRIEAARDAGGALRDWAVLYRAHYVSRTLEEELVRRRIPYTIYSGAPFFGRREVKDALAYLRLAVWRDDLSFARVANVPRRNLGEKRMAFLREHAADEGRPLFDTLRAHLDDPLFKGTGARAFVELVESLADGAETRQASDLLAEALDRSGYERMLRTEGAQDRLDNLAELKQSVHDYETTCGEEATPADYLSRVALFSNRDADAEAADRVRLMTVHAAKGLEFPRVVVCSLSEGVFPTRRTRTQEAMEEERRLAFVALTRARDELVLTQAGGTDFEGDARLPSRFLLDIDPSLLRFEPPAAEGLLAAARDRLREPANAADPGAAAGRKPGDRVRHAVFGAGTVLAIDTEKGATVIRFDSLETPRSIAFRIPLDPA